MNVVLGQYPLPPPKICSLLFAYSLPPPPPDERTIWITPIYIICINYVSCSLKNTEGKNNDNASGRPGDEKI